MLERKNTLTHPRQKAATLSASFAVFGDPNLKDRPPR